MENIAKNKKRFLFGKQCEIVHVCRETGTINKFLPIKR